MPQVIDIPDVGKVEFPDGMDDAAIVAAINGLRAKQPAKPVSGAEKVAKETGAFDAFLIGAGKKTDAVLDGLTQMYLGARGEEATLAALKQKVAEKDALYAPLRRERPFATAAGEALPAVAGGGSVAGGIAAASIPELLSYGTAGDRVKNAGVAAVGSTVGTVAGKAVGRALKPVGAGAAGISRDASDAASRLGLNLSAAQRTQNPAMLATENYLLRSPGSSGAMQARQAANQSAMNRAAASAMGQNADDLSEPVFATAKQAIGNEFERLQQITAPQLGNDFLQVLADLDASNMARGAFKSKHVDHLISKSLDLAAKGNLSGTAYKEIRTQLTNEAQMMNKMGDSTTANAYRAVRKALDHAAEQSLSAADRRAWVTAREQWKAYKQLTASNVAEGGNVSAARLASVVRRDGDALRTGAARGPIADIARVGEAVKSVPNPASGQLSQQMMYGNPVTGIPLVAANKTAQLLYTNPLIQAYLSRGLLDIGPTGQLLLGAAARPAAAPVVRQYLGVE